MSKVIFPYGVRVVALLDTVPRGARDVRALAVHARHAEDLLAGEALPLVPRGSHLGETTFNDFRPSGHRKERPAAAKPPRIEIGTSINYT